MHTTRKKKDEMKRSERNAKKNSIGDRLALDDSAIDGHTKLEISAKGENIATNRWQRRTVGIDSRRNIDHARMV